MHLNDADDTDTGDAAATTRPWIGSPRSAAGPDASAVSSRRWLRLFEASARMIKRPPLQYKEAINCWVQNQRPLSSPATLVCCGYFRAVKTLADGQMRLLRRRFARTRQHECCTPIHDDNNVCGQVFQREFCCFGQSLHTCRASAPRFRRLGQARCARRPRHGVEGAATSSGRFRRLRFHLVDVSTSSNQQVLRLWGVSTSSTGLIQPCSVGQGSMLVWCK